MIRKSKTRAKERINVIKQYWVMIIVWVHVYRIPTSKKGQKMANHNSELNLTKIKDK